MDVRSPGLSLHRVHLRALVLPTLKAACSAAGKSSDLKVLPAGVIYALDWRNSAGGWDAPNQAEMGFAAEYCVGYVTGIAVVPNDAVQGPFHAVFQVECG